MQTSDVVLLHNNEGPHTAARTRALVEHLNWELFDYPSYSLDFAPSDYHSLPTRRPVFLSKRLDNNEELMEVSKRG
jgi:hypothetical protein